MAKHLRLWIFFCSRHIMNILRISRSRRLVLSYAHRRLRSAIRRNLNWKRSIVYYGVQTVLLHTFAIKLDRTKINNNKTSNCICFSFAPEWNCVIVCVAMIRIHSHTRQPLTSTHSHMIGHYCATISANKNVIFLTIWNVNGACSLYERRWHCTPYTLWSFTCTHSHGRVDVVVPSRTHVIIEVVYEYV